MSDLIHNTLSRNAALFANCSVSYDAQLQTQFVSIYCFCVSRPIDFKELGQPVVMEVFLCGLQPVEELMLI